MNEQLSREVELPQTNNDQAELQTMDTSAVDQDAILQTQQRVSSSFQSAGVIEQHPLFKTWRRNVTRQQAAQQKAAQEQAPREQASLQEQAVQHEQATQQDRNQETARIMAARDSLNTVQIFVNSIFAVILYYRKLMKNKCPGYVGIHPDQMFGPHGVRSPAELMTMATVKQNRHSHEHFKLLVRGKEQRTDMLLNLIENGVYKALEYGNLDALQVRICPNGRKQEEVFECYSMRFKYTGVSGANRTLSNVAFQQPDVEDALIFDDASDIFMHIILDLAERLRAMPDLPERRVVSLNMIIFDDTDQRFDLRGWDNKTKPDILYPQSDAIRELVLGSQRFPNMQGSKHQVLLHVDGLQWTDKGEGQQGSEKALPKGLTFNKKVARQHEYELSRKLCSEGRSQVIEELDDDQQGTQDRQDRTVRADLGGMQVSSAPLNHLDSTVPEPTKCSSKTMASILTDREVKALSAKGRRIRHVTPSKVAEGICQWHETPEEERPCQFGEVVVRCECNFHSESIVGFGNMLMRCQFCGFYQHKFCYGYFNHSRFKNTPQYHMCYNCLLLPHETKLNKHMRKLVKYRLALAFMYWYVDEAKVTKKLLNDGNTENIMDFQDRAMHEKAKRFLHEASITRVKTIFKVLTKDGYLRRLSKTMYGVVGKQMAAGLVQIVDPMAKILKHYEVEKDREKKQKDWRELREVGETIKYDETLAAAHTNRIVVKDSFGVKTHRFGAFTKEDRKRSLEDDTGASKKKLRVWSQAAVDFADEDLVMWD